ncbi:hypothetical protein D9619_008867 [Psilocybe cf. subviscida]|uniref:NACHT domain-containing protein n=1 Tax=Psilocybe cf. subviscida TaxID=2480587 RepID=A0A8H5F0U9_9AGAR|nr:hypothetical protein D9619_008867 [Psilocybe cf. subviscida]
MFEGAQNILINGTSSFFNVYAGSSTEGTERLLDKVAPNAILNAGGRADEVRCYPGTREEVIGKMEKWMDGEGSRRTRMMWLSGPAGAGKSAIFQTVAERCRQRGLHAANFFFFRGDTTRNHAQPLVATLVYQLFDLYPALREIIAECLTTTPLILSASIDEQFKQLVSSSFQRIRQSSSITQSIILIIDGLDECDDKRKQEQVLVVLHALIKEEKSPFIVLVASRAEPHLVMSFNKLGASVTPIFRDEEYRPQDDIRHFVVSKFGMIKGTHHLAHALSEDWPAEEDIDAITDKSSGQFIYAATVMRFIQFSSSSPAHSLLIIRGMRPPPANHSPFAQLDALYSYIFSMANDIRAVILCLGAHFIIQSELSDKITMGKMMLTALLRDMAMIEIESSFADLVAIVKVAGVQPIQLVFYHASLSDYLKDQSRSGIYYVDEGEIAAQLSTIGLSNLSDPDSLNFPLWALGYVKIATTELSKSLLAASELRFNEGYGGMLHWNRLILTFERLYLESEPEFFKLLLRRWIRFTYMNNIDIRWDLGGLSPSATRYYKRYRAIERIQCAVGLNN